jgi:hypothetical protein
MGPYDLHWCAVHSKGKGYIVACSVHVLETCCTLLQCI